jgi:hypothetical protein
VKFLQRVVDDLKRGENIDLVVTVIVALVVAALNLFGTAPMGWVDPLGLAVLALLATAILGNRHRLDDIGQKLGQADYAEIMKEFPEELDYELERASEIWLFGVHAVSALRYNRSIIENKLRDGKPIRVLLVDPNGAAVSMTAARLPGKPSVERERTNIRANLDDLCELKREVSGNLEIRVIDDAIFYGGYMLDPDSAGAVVFLRRYTYQAGFTPKLVYRPRDGEWFRLLRSELNSLWNRGVTWSCQIPDEAA